MKEQTEGSPVGVRLREWKNGLIGNLGSVRGMKL